MFGHKSKLPTLNTDEIQHLIMLATTVDPDTIGDGLDGQALKASLYKAKSLLSVDTKSADGSTHKVLRPFTIVRV